MQILTLYDYLLMPVYLAVFYFLVKNYSRKIEDPALKKVFFNSFWLRMLGCLLYSMLLQYYYGYGDSMTYYIGSNFYTDNINENLGNIQYLFTPASEIQRLFDIQVGSIGMSGYMGIGSSAAVMKITSVLSYFSFNKFLIISFFFALFSFAGQWKLFRVFNDINKGQNQKLLSWVVLYTPSIWFWSSGLMKDSVCIGAAGFIIHILYNIFTKRKFSLKYIPLLALFGYTIFVLKPYIILIIGASFAIMIAAKFMYSLKNIFLRLIVIAVFLIGALFVLVQADLTSQMKQFAEESVNQVQEFQNQYQIAQDTDESSKAGFQLATFDPTPLSLIANSPLVIFTCLYRPFLWESSKPIIILSSLESMALLLFTLFLLIRLKIWWFFKLIFTNEYLLFSFVLSLMFALVIGYTTFNFGTIARYKIILLPFYYFMLVTLYNKTLTKVTVISTEV